MLATRGAVYKSEATAGQLDKYHTSCRCRAEVEVDERLREQVQIPDDDANRIILFYSEKMDKVYEYEVQDFITGKRSGQPWLSRPPQPRGYSAPTVKPTTTGAPPQTRAKLAAEAEKSRRLLDGETLVVAKPGYTEFRMPTNWPERKDMRKDWQPKDALALVTKGDWHVIDVDLARGGNPLAVKALLEKRGIPVGGMVRTPGGGMHFYIPKTGIRSGQGGTVDFRGGTADGEGIGLVYLPGTARPKYGGGGYEWAEDLHPVTVPEKYDESIWHVLGELGLRPRR
jgi:hypothetical protein